MASRPVQSQTGRSRHLQALTLEASVPHPLSDALPVGDGSPMGQSLCHRLDEEQEPVVEGRRDGVHLPGQQSLTGVGHVEGTQWGAGGRQWAVLGAGKGMGENIPTGQQGFANDKTASA